MFHTSTLRTSISAVQQGDHTALRAYHLSNASHLAPFEPERPDGYHSEAAWEERVAGLVVEMESGAALSLVAREPGRPGILGVCNFTNLVRGPFQACNLGYSIDHAAEGQGLMFEILGAALRHVFEDMDVHRVMANHLPDNDRSARLLARLGFEREGYARSYLKIAGVWRDHVLTSKINPAHG